MSDCCIMCCKAEGMGTHDYCLPCETNPSCPSVYKDTEDYDELPFDLEIDNYMTDQTKMDSNQVYNSKTGNNKAGNNEKVDNEKVDNEKVGNAITDDHHGKDEKPVEESNKLKDAGTGDAINEKN